MDNQNTIDPKLTKLNELREESSKGGGENRINAQHKRGKLTAYERIELLFDDNTFEEIDPFVLHRSTDFGLEKNKFLGDAVVTGYGKINNRLCFAYSQDFTVLGGSLSEAVSQKICKCMDLAMKSGVPIIGLIDSGGARIQEGIDSLNGYSEIFFRNTRASGVIPQISAILGPAAGGATYSPALTDFIFVVQEIGQMYITGPDVIKAVTGESVSHEELGGALAHSTKSGVSHFATESEEECINKIRKLLTFLPSNNMETTPIVNSNDIGKRKNESLINIIPEASNQPYDMLEIINEIIDNNDFFQIHELFAKNIIVGFSRFNGNSVGIVAQQPSHLAGILDIDASVKAARFVRFCDSFNIPILTLIDVPGFMPGTSQEYGGIIRHGAKLIYAYAEATVPKISLLTRKAYGGAYIVMSSKGLGGDVNYSWPSGQVAVMGAEGAVNVIHRKKLDASETPDELRKNLVNEYEDIFMNPYVAASRGLIDNVIDPTETRDKIIQSLDMLKNKRDIIPPKKHGSIPL
jgi:acetyl-CoA carboxylase carboxyltransferase component